MNNRTRRTCIVSFLFFVTLTWLPIAGAAQSISAAGNASAALPADREGVSEWHAPLAAEWTTDLVDGTLILGGMGNRALALDAQGYPHVAYGTTRLNYAWFDGAAWRYQVVDASTDLAGISLALDAAGRPHISYCRMVWGGYTSRWCDAVKYAHYDGAAWQTETVFSCFGITPYCHEKET